MSDEQAIRDLLTSWHDATRAGDIDTILDLMSDDVVFLVAGQQPMRGRNGFETGLRALLSTHRIESSGDVQEIGVEGDMAYCWSRLSVRVTPLDGGDTQHRAGDVLSIFRRHADGKWRL